MEKFRTLWVPCDEASYYAIADRHLRTYYFTEPEYQFLQLNTLAGATGLIQYDYSIVNNRDCFQPSRKYFIAAP